MVTARNSCILSKIAGCRSPRMIGPLPTGIAALLTHRAKCNSRVRPLRLPHSIDLISTPVADMSDLPAKIQKISDESKNAHGSRPLFHLYQQAARSCRLEQPLEENNGSDEIDQIDPEAPFEM